MGCLPVTSKCCFFVPLRPGLLTWAYIRLILGTAALGFLLYITTGLITLYTRYEEPAEYGLATLMLAYLGVCLIDLVLSIIFVVSLHLEKYKLLLAYYVYGIFEVIVIFSILVLQFFFLATKEPHGERSFWTYGPMQIVVPLVVNILLPIYFLILIRSELHQIKAGGDQSDKKEGGKSHVVLNMPKVTKQDMRYVLGNSKSEPTQTAYEDHTTTTPVFPVEDLRIERLRQQLEGNA